MTYLKMNEVLSKYSKEELETKVKELSNQGIKQAGICRELGVSVETFRRHMAILKDPEGYIEKQTKSRATKSKAEENKELKVLKSVDNLYQRPEDALKKFQRDFKERRKQIMLRELRDAYY